MGQKCSCLIGWGWTGKTNNFTVQLPRTDGTLRGFIFELRLFATVGKLSYTMCKTESSAEPGFIAQRL